MAKKVEPQQAMPGMEAPKVVRKPLPPAAMTVGAYCRGWKSARVGNPPKSITGQVARQAKALVEDGVPTALLIEAAELTGKKGYGAIGLVKMVGQLQASRADVDAAQARTRLIQERGW